MRCLIIGLLLGLAACGGPAPVASYAPGGAIECVPFARALSGIALAGDAPDWWAAAGPPYDRSHAPDTGAVLVFRPTGRLPHGHVSVVADVLTTRRILVTHANWVHGRITQDQPVLDVSPDNDWSAVRVWWEPTHSLGATTYPTFGFIRGPRPLSHAAIAAGTSRAAAIALAEH